MLSPFGFGQRRRASFIAALLAASAAATWVAVPSLACAQDPETSALIFARARGVAQRVERELVPVVLLRIAFDEEPTEPVAAQTDAAAAFDAAGDLLPAGPRPDGIVESDPALGFRWSADVWVETEAILLTTRRSGRERALAMARRARSPHGNLYDQILLYRTGRLPTELRTHAKVEDPAPASQLLPLAKECVAADGTFPFRAAAGMLNGASVESTWRAPLLRLGALAAPREADPASLAAIATFFAVGHRTMPQLDQTLADAASALLENLNRLPADRQQAPRFASGAARVLSVLSQLDPARAQRLKVAMPWAGGFPQSPSAAAPRPVPVPASPAAAAAIADPAGSVESALGLPDASRRFAILVQTALALAGTNPDLARRAADGLPALAPSDFGDSLAPAARLAVVMFQNLGDRDNALALMGECLDAAALQAAAAETSLTGAEPQVRAARELRWLRPIPEPWVAVYGSAARIEPPTAIAGAAHVPLPYTPLVLSQIAKAVAATH